MDRVQLVDVDTKLELKKIIAEKLSSTYKLKYNPEDINLIRPKDESLGGLTSNFAFGVSQAVGIPATTVSGLITSQITSDPKYISIGGEKAVSAGPGFANFQIAESLPTIDDSYGTTKIKTPKRIVIEMGDPNTHKLPHIGHLFNYIVGDTIARTQEFLGNKICKVTWQGDVGPHVAKAIYGWRKRGKKDPKDVIERMRELQEGYVLGAKESEKNDEAEEEIKKINKQIYAEDKEVLEDWKITKKWSIDFDEYFEKKLGIKIEFRYLEGDQWKNGVEIVEKNTGKVFEKSEGAIVFKGEKYGLHTRVFLTKEGTPTYEAKELGLNTQKMKDFPYDLTIIPTASEQNGYFKVVIKALELSIPALLGKVKHVGTGMINLSSGKMSSREGNIISGPDLVFTVEKRIKEIVEKRKELSEKEKEEIANKVTIGAIKFAFLKSNILQDSTFDIEESVSFSGNSGPYIQYTFVRANNILKESGEKSFQLPKESEKSLNSPEEQSLLKAITDFPEVVKETADNYAPHTLAGYLFDLAQKFNHFYKTHKVIKAEKKGRDARLALVKATTIVLKNGLGLLGIETLEKM